MRLFRTLLGLVFVVAGATLLRSVALERWATVLAALAMMVGAAAAARARTWGLAWTTVAAAAFAGAALLRLGPWWFWGVALVGVAPHAVSLPAMARFDRAASALLAVAGVCAGLALAWGYESVGPSLLARVGR